MAKEKRFKKGSKEAKAYMAKLRAKSGKGTAKKAFVKKPIVMMKEEEHM